MSKGGENEREIAKYLTIWLTGKKKPYMFWRQDASGGLSTVHIENSHMTGDICSIHPDSRWFVDIFTIECKTGYPKTSFWQHFTSANFGIEEFWIQTLTDARKSNKEPMLIFRKKGRRWIIGIGENAYKRLYKRLEHLNHICLCWNKESKLQGCYIYDMCDFFETIKPDEMKKIFTVD